MLIRTPEQDIERILFTEKTIAARVEQLAGELTAKYGDKRPVLVCVLKGAAFFYIDLCRCMNCPIDMDFIAVSSDGRAKSPHPAFRVRAWPRNSCRITRASPA